jgi:4-cresol dehydrogenase (hydroxylating)
MLVNYNVDNIGGGARIGARGRDANERREIAKPRLSFDAYAVLHHSACSHGGFALMRLILPAGVSAAAFDKALKAFAGVIGQQHVYTSDEDRDTYLDVYAPDDPVSYGPSGAIAPKTVEEIQALLKIAREFRIPLWPISRGKNFGYGGSAPCMRGTLMLDLVRMNRILEVNEELGYAVLEPGVGFYDLFEHLKKNNIRLWMSAPAQTWGSVVGNALERGVGYTPYGDHASKVCGMEVVLPTGELVRTGMGAMKNSTSWQLFKYGFGPSWDNVFMQSNFGVVTKMGLWMMPEPEATLSMSMNMPNDSDLAPVIDTLRPLKLNGVIQSNPSVGNAIRTIAIRTTRDQWYRGEGAMPDSVIQEAAAKLGVGRWNFSIRLFGYAESNAVNAKIIKQAFAKITQQEFETTEWHRGQPIERSGAAVPTLGPLSIVNWRGGRGGHLTFSPISPPRGEDAVKQYQTTRKRYEEFGFDYSGGFTAGERYLNHISMILFDRNDTDMTRRARELFKTLVREAAANGYGEYRTHVNYYDDVANTYDFNGNAITRLNERVKDALDPDGILAPGRMGIWPKHLRKRDA